MSKEFEIGRKRALAEIERMAQAPRNRVKIENVTPKPEKIERTPMERLGFERRPSLADAAMTPEADARTPFVNSLALAKVLRPFDPAVRASGRELLDASRHNRRRAMARLGFKVD